MRILAQFFLFLFSANCIAWTCDLGRAVESKENLETHITAASDILFGLVSHAEYDSTAENYPLTFTLKIFHTVKGDKVEEVVLKSDPASYVEDIVVGDSYIFSLYGNNEISSCGFNLHFGRNVTGFKDLHHIADSPNAIHNEIVRWILQYTEPAFH